MWWPATAQQGVTPEDEGIMGLRARWLLKWLRFLGCSGSGLGMSGRLGQVGRWASCQHMGRIVPFDFVSCWAGTMS
jgi:hypothetical protein